MYFFAESPKHCYCQGESGHSFPSWPTRRRDSTRSDRKNIGDRKEKPPQPIEISRNAEEVADYLTGVVETELAGLK
jgi:hypothetical protein